MNAQARIGILHADKSSDSIYCHRSGYPFRVAPILLHSYNDIQKARELIALGDISSLGNNITPLDDTREHTFDNPQEDTVVAYHRDRGDEWKYVKPMHAKTMRGLLMNKAAKYIYLFDESTGAWIYSEGTNMYIENPKNGKLEYHKSAHFRNVTEAAEKNQ